MIKSTIKTTINSLILITSTNALAQEYLCSFHQNGQTDNRNNFSGEHIFSSELPDTNALPCGEVNQKFIKLQSSTSLPYGQINANWGDNGSITIPDGNIEINIYQVSKKNGQACTSLMEISSRNINLYSGEPLSNFSVSTEGTGISSYVLDKTYYIENNGSWQTLINNLSLISSYNGTSYFDCVISQ